MELEVVLKIRLFYNLGKRINDKVIIKFLFLNYYILNRKIRFLIIIFERELEI